MDSFVETIKNGFAALGQALGPLLPLIPLGALIIHGLVARQSAPARPGVDPGAAFHSAMLDAAIRDPRNITGNLTAIRADNNDLIWRTTEHKELLAVTFVRSAIADQFYKDPGGGEKAGVAPDGEPYLWVTAAPEIQRFCERLDLKDPLPRLRQYLGLGTASQNDTIVELWVSREDLFRPCPDPEVSDSVCTLRTAEPTPSVKNIPDYGRFLLRLHENSYSVTGLPWTGLGYTYDWAHGTHSVGASEFIIIPKSTYTVHSVQAAAKYCAR